VPKEILNPVQSWKNQSDYMEKARDLARKFRENFQQYEKDCQPKTLEAGPII
jgi:phosphoenolpyruvate carboxykinase (ATP)